MKKSGAMESCAYGSCIHYWSGTLINTSRLFFQAVPDQKSSMIKQILRVIFSRNGIPKTLVSDNAPEFYDEDLNLWLEKIRCKPYKTSPYHPQSNGLAEIMVQTVKMGLKACSQQQRKNRCFSIALKLPHNTTRRKTRKSFSFNRKVS